MGGHSGNCGDAMEWSDECVKYFLDLLAEKVKKDPNSAPILKTSDWNEMDEKIFVTFALKYGPDKLKAKYNRLRIMHTKFTELINKTGVTWDSETGLVFAHDDVWKTFIQQNKAFKTIKKKGCKIYPLLSAVFSKSTASGTFHNASTTAPLTSPQEHRLEDEYLGDADFGDSVGGSSTGKKRMPDMDIEGQPGSRRAKRSSGKDKIDALMDAWSESMIARKEKDLAKAERYKVKPDEATSFTSDDEFSISNCMLVLNDTPSVSTKCYNKALQHFHDVTWRKIFLLMPEDRRKGWLDSLDN
ncbi:hypothetical protein SSX86_021767 [Deinandra increscens subsp. villosa]|uniref:Myb/SANT-like domain-containing protein n=1 Tax=Deinandra increscens subsp. villosa TaxID=3103831 RepID=A0AAP0CRC2_9ASTR